MNKLTISNLKVVLSLSQLLSLSLTLAQDIPLNTWRSHFSYSNARILERAENTLFCAVENGLFTYDLENKEIRKLSKEHGLGDVKISAMHYASQASTMVIGYESGIIDLIDDSGNITTIYTLRDVQIVADKRIHSISSEGSKLYLATDFGVVLLDLAINDVKENYRNIGFDGAKLAVNEIMITNGVIYIVSDDGIRAGDLSNNLLDFNSWSYFTETSSGNFENITTGDGEINCIRDGQELWVLNTDIWVDTGILIPEEVVSLYWDNELIALTESKVYSAQSNPAEILDFSQIGMNGADLIKESNSIWIADGGSGLLVSNGENIESALPSGPSSDYPSRLKWVDNQTFAFYSDPSKNQLINYDGYSVFRDGIWSQNSISGFYNITDVVSLNGAYFFSSLGYGLYDQASDLIYNETNSNLTVGGGFGGVQLSALGDFDNSIWVLSYNSSNALYRIDQERSIFPFSGSEVGSSLGLDIDISNEGVFWIVRSGSEGGGIATFDPILELQRTIRTSDNLPSSSVTGVAIDADDEVWISTVSGVANFSQGSYPFTEFDISIPVFQNGFLFKDEQINDVMTDGGGRIWFATKNGVWVITRDLSTIVHQFTTMNSPLPSNNVLQFSYNEENGEVFLGTDRGIVSYRSTSSMAGEFHGSRIGVFPNPVRLGMSESVGFTELARNSLLKITDVRGRLINQVQANGGMASWNLKTHNGSTVQSGIYLIFSSSADGVETLVGKVAVVE